MFDLKKLIEKEKFVLYVVTDDKFLPQSAGRKDISKIKEIVRRCKDGGVKILQYRAKKLDMFIQLKQAEEMKYECEKEGIFFFVNDRADLAYIIGENKIHIGQEDIPPEKLKEKFNDFIIGLSTHNIRQVKDAMKKKHLLNYISFGPIFKTKTKENPYPTTGIENLKRAIKLSDLPVVAIGGINYDNIDKVVKASARAVAVISYILENPKEIEKRSQKLIKKALENMS
ncbi:Thiamine-phosphate synthase [bacterium HR19]|nr:Thiamine-phosphate synthase [bacterium HR19]